MRDSYNKYLGTRINQLVSIAVNGGVANLYAQVKDLAGVNLIVPGETVTFTVNDPLLGTLSAVTLTNGAGVATANFTSGATLGTAIINASVTNHSAVTFTSTATVPIITPGFIAGRVTNVTSGAAIAGATVTAGGLTNTTNATGFYNISLVAGTYTVNVTAAGYVAQSAPVTVTSGATFTQNFALVPAVVGAKGCVVNPACTAATIADALFIAQHTVSISTLTPAQLAAADVSGDGAVTITDALFIAQFTVGIRLTL